jgi:hypothetical protein
VFDYLSGAIKIGETLVFDELPRLADWAEYAAAVYEHGGHGVAQFQADWSEVGGKQNESAVEGSPVAQTIISIMKVHTRFEKTSTQMLEALATEAEKLGINIKRDKTWPKSPTWLWRRIKEVQPALGAYGISADNDEKRRPRTILLTLDGGPDSRFRSAGGSVDGSESAAPKGSSAADSSDGKSGHSAGSFLDPEDENGRLCRGNRSRNTPTPQRLHKC